MRAAIYIRVSTDEQAARGLSLDVQEARCREQAERHGARSVAVYRDEGYTSLSTARPALQRLLADLPRLDRIYVLDQSRWSRDPADLEALRARLLDADVVLVPLSTPLDQESPYGQFTSRVLVAADRLAVDVSRAKSVASLTELAARGHHHGRCPLGYRRPRDAAGHIIRDAPLEVDPAQAAVVHRIYESYARGGSLSAIAQTLNADGVRTARGTEHWSPTQVTGVLRNPVYRGLIRHHGELLPAGHEPLVSERLWGAVQARREREQLIHPPARATLAPLLRCGLCGGGVHRSAAGRGGSRIYRCADHYHRAPADRHEPLTKSAVAVEAVIWAWTRALLGGDLIAAALAPPSSSEPSPSSVGQASSLPTADLQAELCALEGAISYNLEAARANALPPDLLARENAPLLARREEVLRELRGPAASTWTAAEVRWLEAATPELVDRIAGLADAGRQRQFLERLYRRIVLHRGGLVFAHRLAGLPLRGVAYPTWHGPRGWSEVDLAPWSPDDDYPGG